MYSDIFNHSYFNSKDMFKIKINDSFVEYEYQLKTNEESIESILKKICDSLDEDFDEVVTTQLMTWIKRTNYQNDNITEIK